MPVLFMSFLSSGPDGPSSPSCPPYLVWGGTVAVLLLSVLEHDRPLRAV
jgi:hypothetical protein